VVFFVRIGVGFMDAERGVQGGRDARPVETKLHFDREICLRRVQRTQSTNKRQESTRTTNRATRKRAQMNRHK
jgi:hypothetical protein